MMTDGPRNEARESKGAVDETKRERAKGRSTKRNESKTKTSERNSEACGRRARNREDGMNLQKRSASETTCKCYISHTWHAVVHAWFPKTSCNIRQQLSRGPAGAPTPPAAAPRARTAHRCCRGPIVDHRQESSLAFHRKIRMEPPDVI